MKVQKKDPNWFPSEKPMMKVGEIIEITDAKQLIINGTVVAIGEDGENISAFDLYGEMIPSEIEEFQTFMKLKKAEAAKKALEEEKILLRKKLDEENLVEKAKEVEVKEAEIKKTETLVQTARRLDPKGNKSKIK